MNNRVAILSLLGMFLGFPLPAPAASGQKLEGVVNINTASPEELGLLPGIGPARASQILAYRKVRLFRTIDELVRIKGIGRKTVLKLRPHLTVSGPTTARRTKKEPTKPAAPATPN